MKGMDGSRLAEDKSEEFTGTALKKGVFKKRKSGGNQVRF
jgi:hypothetical protein